MLGFSQTQRRRVLNRAVNAAFAAPFVVFGVAGLTLTQQVLVAGTVDLPCLAGSERVTPMFVEALPLPAVTWSSRMPV